MNCYDKDDILVVDPMWCSVEDDMFKCCANTAVKKNDVTSSYISEGIEWVNLESDKSTDDIYKEPVSNESTIPGDYNLRKKSIRRTRYTNRSYRNIKKTCRTV